MTSTNFKIKKDEKISYDDLNPKLRDFLSSLSGWFQLDSWVRYASEIIDKNTIRRIDSTNKDTYTQFSINNKDEIVILRTYISSDEDPKQLKEELKTKYISTYGLNPYGETSKFKVHFKIDDLRLNLFKLNKYEKELNEKIMELIYKKLVREWKKVSKLVLGKKNNDKLKKIIEDYYEEGMVIMIWFNTEKLTPKILPYQIQGLNIEQKALRSDIRINISTKGLVYDEYPFQALLDNRAEDKDSIIGSIKYLLEEIKSIKYLFQVMEKTLELPIADNSEQFLKYLKGNYGIIIDITH
jgi:hypothetical protein